MKSYEQLMYELTHCRTQLEELLADIKEEEKEEEGV